MHLYPYQERVKELIKNGQSVILQAPTGAGKTLAALAPFIESFFDRPADEFPRKCIYSVPMRVLANQFMVEYSRYSGAYKRKFRRSLNVSIQTGDRPDDPKLESNLIFSTIDQTLSSFLNIPYALGTGSANLNAGAILSSYLVFDELHLYDPDATLPTTLEMLRMLKVITPFIAMTATFSSQMLGKLGKLLNAKVVPEDEEARLKMEMVGSQVGKMRRFHTVDMPLKAEAVVGPEQKANRVICICNTVYRAQTLYKTIKDLLAKQNDRETIVKLIHSRFYKSDRDEKEEWIKEQFGKAQSEYDGPPLILIATQVIEVGVDATCDVMHSELAPAASLLQRAGRCARRENETGDVYIYMPRDEDGNPDFAPYYLKSKSIRTQRGLELCQATWDHLNSTQFSGKNMTFRQEQTLIDQVHTPIDQEILNEIRDSRHLHRSYVLRTMQEQDQSMSSELIRDVDSRFVIIHPDPDHDENLVHNPWYYDGFAFSPGTLARAFKETSEVSDSEIPWLMKAAGKLTTNNAYEDEENPSRQPFEYTWYPLLESGEVYKSAVLAVHPLIAQYSEEFGIMFHASDGSYRLTRRSGSRRSEIYAYRRESYAEHITGLYRAYQNGVTDRQSGLYRLPLRDEIAFAARRIESRFGIPTYTLDRMIRAVFVCHDLGKLNIEWQEWAHEWQRQVSRLTDQDMTQAEDYMLAHMDFDASPEQKALQRKLGKRPRHAGEGAMSTVGLIEAVCEDHLELGRAGLTAIARHHSAGTDNHTAYRIHPGGEKAVAESLYALDLPVDLANQILWVENGKHMLQEVLISFSESDMQEVLLYFLIIRILRLADQRSQSS